MISDEMNAMIGKASLDVHLLQGRVLHEDPPSVEQVAEEHPHDQAAVR